MAVKTILLAGIALAGHVAAQSSCQPSGGPFTISSQGDAGSISGCTTFSGSIAVATGVTSNLAIDGIQKITGDLIVSNVGALSSLSANDLQTIEGTFAMNNMTILSTLAMPQLNAVHAIQWETLPRLTSLNFGTDSGGGGVTSAATVNIIDTQLFALTGLNLETVSEMTISSNNQLSSVKLPILSIDLGVAIQFNANQMEVDFPNLETAYNMTFRNVSSLSMPALSTVNSSVGFYGCTFDTLDLNNLTEVGGDISFYGNSKLTNVTLPELTAITGALKMSDNNALNTINGLPLLKNIQGAIDVSGNFSNFTLPSLHSVLGACNIQSSQIIDSTCKTFNGYHNSGVIQGKTECLTTANPQSNASGTASGSSGAPSATSTQKGSAASDLYARSAAVTGLLGVIAALVGLL